MKILLLGVGMQGKAALYNLVNSDEVTEVIAADYDYEGMKEHVATMKYGDNVRCKPVDASDVESMERLVAETMPDVIIDLLPVAFLGNVASVAVKRGIHLVNTFYTRPQLRALADDAKQQEITILPEFGLDPGIDLVMLGEALRSLDVVEEIRCYGAGLPEPEACDNPIKYKVTWTFEGVLKAYRRPGRIIRNGEIVEIKDNEQMRPEHVHELAVEGMGKLEAFPNGDALKYADVLGVDPSTLKNMARYTCRWPGHSAFWRKLVDLHLLDDEPVMVDGVPVDRRKFLAAVIEPHIQLQEDERDIALVRNVVTGIKDGKRVRLIYQVLDRRDLESGFTAMSRTVGYTASIGAILIGTGKITKRGLLSPVRDVPYEIFVAELRKRGIEVTMAMEKA
jgi:saccharopine dehydrogenase-like NADP-dependent oxidoreductase